MPFKTKTERKPNKHELAELDLSNLARLYRNIEGDNVTYSSAPSGKLKIQRNVLSIYRKEQDNLFADLNIAISTLKCKQDNEALSYLHQLLDEYKCLGRSVQTEKTQLIEMDEKIVKMGKNVDKIKQKTVSDLQRQLRVIAAQKSVTQLETKLDSCVKRVNLTITENAKLRQEIEHLLIERQQFGILWYKVINCLTLGKKFMLDLIEQATVTYNERNEWIHKIRVLRDIGKHDLTNHREEMRILKIKVDDREKFNEFLGIKGEKRILKDLEGRILRKKQRARESLEQQMKNYQETLNEITSMCNENDVQKLTLKFLMAEKDNFSLFSYINELNYETEELCEINTVLKQNIDKQKNQNDLYRKQQKEDIEKLTAQLTAEQLKAAEAKAILEKYDASIEKLFDSVDKMFFILQCDDDPILGLLFGAAVGELEDETEQVVTITKYNVLFYLQIIEKRVIEIMQMVYNKEQTAAIQSKKAKVQPVRLIKPDIKSRYRHNSLHILVPSEPCPLCVEQELVSDVIDTLQYARNQEQVERALSARMKLPHALDRIHNVSACHLPQSRKIIQQRYQ